MHANTKLTFHSRYKLVQDYQAGRRVVDLADALGVSRKTIYAWLRRFTLEGVAGLHDRGSRPHAVHYRLPEDQVATLVARRQETWWGPRRLVGCCSASASTIYRILRRRGLHRRPALRRQVVRYEAGAPGALVHLDLLHLATAQGRSWYQVTLIDDYSREVWATVVSRRTTNVLLQALAAAQAALGYPFAAVMTDNDAAFTVEALPQAYHRLDGGNEGRFTAALRAQGIRHVRTQVRRPETNGKVERFHRTVREECWRPFARQLGVTLDGVAALPKEERRRQAALLAKPIAWEEPLVKYLQYYNENRPHTALNGNAPTVRRKAFFAQALSPTS